MTESASRRETPRVAVVGSGFGGLAVAIRLQAAGVRTVLFEARDKPGGRAYVYEQDGFVFDAGPTVITAPPCLEELFEAAGRRLADYVELLRQGRSRRAVAAARSPDLAEVELLFQRICRDRPVDPADSFESLGGDGVDVALAQDDEVLAPDLDLVAVLGVEQHLVAGLHRPDVRAGRHDLSPRQALAHLCRGRDEDAAARAPLAVRLQVHQDPVVEHLDRQLVGARRRAATAGRGGCRRGLVGRRGLGIGHVSDGTGRHRRSANPRRGVTQGGR